jgi:hypothetical protein
MEFRPFYWVRNLVCHARKEYWLTLFEKTLLIRIFVPNEKEVIEEWRQLHNEELHDLYPFQVL